MARWLDAHPEATPLGLAHWCPVVDPRVAGIEYTKPPAEPRPGWYAISVNELHRQSRRYDYFLRFEPVAMAGYSIYIDHITAEEANHVRRELGLRELPAERRE